MEDRRVEGDVTERGEGWSASLCAWKRTSFAKKKWVSVRACVCVCAFIPGDVMLFEQTVLR